MSKPNIETWHDLHPDTLAVRAGTERSQFGEHSEAMFLTSSFVFASAKEAADRFSGQTEGPVYARFTNPSVAMFETRLAALEGTEDAMATATGMAAIATACLGLLSSGDHIVASKSLFGATIQLFTQVFARFGIATTFVDGHNPQAWHDAIQPNTRLFYLETPSNPLTEIVDLNAVCGLARNKGIITLVDNCFCTPALQKPVQFGADLIIHSATKYLDGQGRVLGGAICGPKTILREKLLPVLRTVGATLSAFNAWVLHKGLETLSLRMQAQSANAMALAQWLENQPEVQRVYYPGLVSHPQHHLAMQQQSTGGAIVSFEVATQTKAWAIIDGCKVLSITANLGDTRSTITHPATTTHGRLNPEARDAAGIKPGLIRIAVGLEHISDLQRDLARGLQQQFA